MNFLLKVDLKVNLERPDSMCMVAYYNLSVKKT